MTVALPFHKTEVEAAYAAFSVSARDRLLATRSLIFREAEDPLIGPLTETLRWGEPSYLTELSGSGSTIRLGVTKAGQPALFVHCATTLIADFKDLYGDLLEFEGKRAMLLPEAPGQSDVLSHCIRLALTYHSRKKRRG